MLETLVRSNPWLLLCLLGAVCLTLFLLTTVIMGISAGSKRHLAEIQLKRELAAKGMSAADIERVLWVSPTNAPRQERAVVHGTLADTERELVEKMLDEGRAMDEVERMVRLLRGQAAPSSEPCNLQTLERM